MDVPRSSSSLSQLLSDVHRYLLLILFILGNLGHLLSAIILSRKSWRKKVCVFYFYVLFVYNTIYINTRVLGSVIRFHFKITIQDQNMVACKLYSYVNNLFTVLTPTVLALASIDRLLISSHNVDTRLYSSKRLAYFSISIGTAVWSLFYLHALINHKLQQFAPFSPPICFYDMSNTLIEFYTYSTVLINLFVSLAMITLVVLALINVRRNRRRLQRNPPAREMGRKDVQLLRCLFVHDIVFALFSLPIHVYYLCITITRDYQPTGSEESLKSVFYNFLFLIYHIPYCCSFSIFILVSKGVRLEAKRLMQKVFHPSSAPPPPPPPPIQVPVNTITPIVVSEKSRP